MNRLNLIIKLSEMMNRNKHAPKVSVIILSNNDKRCLSERLDAIRKNADDINLLIKTDKFDGVVSFQVIEHVGSASGIG